MKITGAPLTELDQLGEQIASATTREIRSCLKTVTQRWGADPSVDDLGRVRGLFDARVDSALMPHLADAYWRSVNAISAPLIEHLAARRGQTAAAPSGGATGPDPERTLADPGLPAPAASTGVAIARVSNQAAAQYMADARNRLVAIADVVWEHARTELVTGMQLGEGVAKLASRVSTVAAALAEPRAEVIARTEVNGAANAGALGQVRAIDVPGRKTWIATEDERTRPDHSDADGQEVGVDETFDVGGESMDRPHDESASAGQTINCRCTMAFSIPEDDVIDIGDQGDGETASAEPHIPVDYPYPDLIRARLVPERAASLIYMSLAAAADVMTDAMIALVPSDADCARLALPGGEPADQLHCTLFYLGEAATWDDVARQSVIANMGSLFDGFGQIPGQVFGCACWNPDSDQPACVLNVGDVNPGMLAEAAQTAELGLDASGYESLVPAQHTPWCAHICVAYSTDMAIMDKMMSMIGPVVFDRLRVAFAGTVTDIPLQGGPTS